MTTVQQATFHASEACLVADAVHALLVPRLDMRLVTVCRPCEHGTVLLGKTAELAGIDKVRLK